MKKLIFFLLIIICGALAFFGLHQTPADSVVVVETKFRGTKTFFPGEWYFFPEAIIPGSMKIKKFPSRISFYSKKRFDFPYSNVVDYFKGFKFEILLRVYFEVGFSVEYVFTDKNISTFADKPDLKTFKKDLIKKIEDVISSVINQNLSNEEFSKEKLLDSLKKESKYMGFPIEFVVISFPLWEDYSYFLKRLTDTSQRRGAFGLLGQSKSAGRQ